MIVPYKVESIGVRATSIIATIALAVSLLIAHAPDVAKADTVLGCCDKKVVFSFEPDAHLHSKAGIEHTSRVYTYTSVSLWWNTWCGASGGTHNSIVDMYQSVTIQKLVSGSYSTCYTKTKGWKGNTDNDPWYAEFDESIIRSNCNWTPTGNPIRAKNLGKFQQSNGTVHSVWGTTSAHSG